MGIALGGVTSLVSIVTIGQVWATCDVGGNASTHSLSLLFLVPFIWFAAAVPWVVLYGALGRHHRGAALAAGLLFSAWFAWFLVTWLGTMDSYPDPLCPGNVPPWWPSFIPA